MHSLKLKYCRDGIYSRIDYSANSNMEMIVNFLIEIGGLVDLVKQGLIEDKSFYFNITYLDIDNNEVILFYPNEDDPKFKTKIPYKIFIQLLNDWWDVYKNYPAFIEITMDDDENIAIKALEYHLQFH